MFGSGAGAGVVILIALCGLLGIIFFLAAEPLLLKWLLARFYGAKYSYAEVLRISAATNIFPLLLIVMLVAFSPVRSENLFYSVSLVLFLTVKSLMLSSDLKVNNVKEPLNNRLNFVQPAFLRDFWTTFRPRSPV